MLKRVELIELERALRATRVLSVYLDGEERNPAERTAWRRAFTGALDRLRASLEDRTREERQAFESCVTLVESALGGFTGFLPAPGWVAFVTPDGVRYAEALPTKTPLLVTWQDGARIAPYLRACEKRRPVHLAVVDARSARVYRLAGETLEKVESLHAYANREKPESMGQEPPRHGFHPGTRGGTAADLGERELLIARERLMNLLADRLVARSGREGWIVLGGTPAAVAAAEAAIPSPLRSRVSLRADIDVNATEAQLTVAAKKASDEFRAARELDIVEDILGRWAAAGKGMAKAEPTLLAIKEGSVDHLCLSESFLLAHPDDAETAVRGALDQGADVELVTGVAADRLDAVGGGIAARLRHVAWKPPVSTPSYATS